MNMKMLVCMYKSHLQTLVFKHHTLPNLNHCLIRPVIRSYTTKRIIDSSDFKISFLKDKCGLSGKSLIYASKCVDFDSSDQRPHSVLELFRSFGFPQPNITKIISSFPLILFNYHPQNIIKPKLDFLLTIFQSQADVVAIVTKIPIVLSRSLNNHLIPSFNLLDSVTGCYPNTLSVLKQNPYILTSDLNKYLLLNTQFLLTLGAAHSQILRLLKSYGQVLGIPHEKFGNSVSKVLDMSFDLESSYFCKAVHTLCYVSESTWKSRCVLFRSFGFSDQEIFSMFKKHPHIMIYTEKTIIRKIEFFLNKLHWTPFRLSSNPSVLSYSLEKRIIPRCLVLQILVSKKSTSKSKSYMLSTIFATSERKFIENFVTANKGEVPEVVEAYQGKLKFDEYTFKQKGEILKPEGAPLDADIVTILNVDE